MADNVTLPGTGVSVSSEEITSLNAATVDAQQAQRMIVSLRTDDATAVDLPGDATNGLDVDVTRLPTLANVTTLGTITNVVHVDDNGGALTVDGTITANLSATDNAVLDAIQAAVETIDNAISGSEMQVDVLTMPTVTVNAHAVTNAGTFATQVDGAALTALQLIDNCISGSEAQVDVVAALPAGSNNIGDVDVLSVIPGTGATNLAKSAFTGHPTGAVGVPVFGEKSASLTDWSGEADGTYLPLFQDSDGRLYVNASLTVDGDGANATTKMMGSDYDGGWNPMLVDTNGVIAVNLNNAPVIERTGIMRDASLVTVTPKYAVISASSSGNNTIVAAVADKKIRVLSVSLSASAAVNAKFQSAAGGTDITGLYYLAANGGMVLPHNIHGWFETAASALLNLNLSAANAVGGSITYIEV